MLATPPPLPPPPPQLCVAAEITFSIHLALSSNWLCSYFTRGGLSWREKENVKCGRVTLSTCSQWRQICEESPVTHVSIKASVPLSTICTKTKVKKKVTCLKASMQNLSVANFLKALKQIFAICFTYCKWWGFTWPHNDLTKLEQHMVIWHEGFLYLFFLCSSHCFEVGGTKCMAELFSL